MTFWLETTETDHNQVQLTHSILMFDFLSSVVWCVDERHRVTIDVEELRRMDGTEFERHFRVKISTFQVQNNTIFSATRSVDLPLFMQFFLLVFRY